MTDDKTFDMWIDILGQPFGPGDRIAFARPFGEGSALIDMGEVIRINRTNAKGEPYTDREGNPSPTITVRPENIGRGRWWGTQKKDGTTKAMNIRNPNNVIRVVAPLSLKDASDRAVEFFKSLEPVDAS